MTLQRRAPAPGFSAFTSGVWNASPCFDGSRAREQLTFFAFPTVAVGTTTAVKGSIMLHAHGRIVGLPTALPTSGTIHFSLVGTLTAHGVTRSTSWTVSALAAKDVQYW